VSDASLDRVPDVAAGALRSTRAGDPLTQTSTSQLLALYGTILTLLRERGIVRSENSPVGDYAEYLAARAFGLTLTQNSAIGWDGVDAAGARYQVKGRRITPWNPSRQLSAIRGLEPGQADPFDSLVGILFNGDFTIMRAAIVPLSVVRLQARPQPRVNGWRFVLTEAVWLIPGVEDATEKVRGALEA
jgi:hypothetical protein